MTTQELRDLAAAVLEREEGEESVSRYRRWHELRHLERPLIVLIGGAPGTGKSTVATQVAHRLGITRIVSSDVVRQVMRGVIAPEVLPQIHTSSFEAADLIPVGTGGDRTIAGFWQQAETVRRRPAQRRLPRGRGAVPARHRGRAHRARHAAGRRPVSRPRGRGAAVLVVARAASARTS